MRGGERGGTAVEILEDRTTAAADLVDLKWDAIRTFRLWMSLFSQFLHKPKPSTKAIHISASFYLQGMRRRAFPYFLFHLCLSPPPSPLVT